MALCVASMWTRLRLGALLPFHVLLGCADTSVDLFPSPDGQSTADAPHETSAAAFDATGQSREGGDTSGCLSDSDCTSREATRCEPALHVCVQCIGMGDCVEGANSTCNRVTNRCVEPCTTDGDCESSDVCDPSQGACAECLDDSQCTQSREKKCVQETCVECANAQDCPAGNLCWQATCVACVTGADCPDKESCSTDHVCH
jgi:hypothetical protein